MQNKRGAMDFGVSISIFVFIMALLMVIYLLLIPPEERDKVLEDRNVLSVDCENDCRQDLDICKRGCDSFNCELRCNDDFRDCRDGCVRGGPDVLGNILLSESPGIVRPIENFRLNVDLNPLSLFSQTRRSNMALAGSIYVQSWLFGKEEKSVVFDIVNLKNIGKASLVFFPGDKNGVLEIKLNENLVYSGGAGVNDLPIDLPVGSLKEGKNRITFSAKSKGLGKSYFNLADISLAIGSYEENLRSGRSFVLAKEEIAGIKRSYLSYFISCGNIYVSQGNLRIDFNGKTLYDDMVFCDAGSPSLDISKSLVREETNTINFVLKPRGENSYDITNIRFNADMRNFEYPKYRFDLGRRQFEDVVNRRADLILHIIMNNDGLRKEAAVNVNGAELYFNTNSAFVNLDLSDFAVIGSNFIKIIPRTAFEINRLDAVLE